MATQKKQEGKEDSKRQLRAIAEAKLAQSFGTSPEVKRKTLQKFVHELQVHQIELEIQNEELKTAQLALEESRQKYIDLYDFAPVGYFTFTGEALIAEVNLTGAALLGIERQKLINSRFRRCIAPECQGLWDTHFLSILQRGEKQSCELVLRREDGSTFYARMDSIAMETPGGTSVVRTGVTDITDRKQAEEAFCKSEAKYRSIFENAIEGIFQTTPEGRFITVNPAHARILGYDSPEDLMNSVSDTGRQLFVDLEQRKEYLRLLHEKRVIESFEVQVYRKDGTKIWISFNVRAVGDDTGSVQFFEGTVGDITSRKWTEEKLKETLETLRKAITTTIQVLVMAVETRDPYTAGHQRRTTGLARAIAKEMGLPQHIIEGIRMAGAIHDIGKISVPAEILSKPTKLTDIELELVMSHAQNGYEIIKNVESSWPLADIVYQHHERINGSGYPQGLKGEDTLIEARIIAVADVVEAIASHRPYRPALGIGAALEEIEKNKGILYDEKAVEVCLKLFREKQFSFE